MSNFISNAFMMPNDLIDKGYMAKMKGAALPCYIFIVRKTRGWNKQTDKISISQFVEASGYNKDTVRKGLDILENLGVIKQIESDSQVNEWVITDQILAENTIKNDENLTKNHTKNSHGENSAMLKNSMELGENLASNHTKNSPHNNNIKTKKTREGDFVENPSENQNPSPEQNSVEHTLKIWTPNLDSLNSWLQRSGLPKISQGQTEEILLEINPHYENKIITGAVTDTQMYSNFVKWIKRDNKLVEKLMQQAASANVQPEQQNQLLINLPSKPKGFLGAAQ